MSRSMIPALVSLVALFGCNEAPTGLLVDLVPVASDDAERRVTSADDFHVRFISTSRDSDFDEVTYTFDWSVDGAARAEFTGPDVPADSTTKGEVWSVIVTPSDGVKTGTPATAEVTIGNTAPVASVAATAIEVRSTETLEITGSGTDFDGDTVEIQYYWLNTGKGTPFDGPRVPAAATYPGEIWTGHAVPFDGEVRGKAATVQIVIRNGVPSVTDLTLSPEAAYVTDDIVATALSSDPDRQPVSLLYVWTVDGTEVQRGNARNVLPKGRFTKHQNIQVTVTPDDGVDSGEPLSASLTVNNTLPTQPGAAIFPDEPIPKIDDMRCGLTAPSFDADGDEINYRIEWTVNGSKYTGAVTSELPGDTIDRGAFFDDEEWKCTIVPSDDDVDGPSVVVEIIPLTWKGAREFSPCGATGAKGPTQTKCDTGDGYLNTALEGEVNVDTGIQEWMVPVDGTYRITARGGQGSASTGSPYTYSAGVGAIVRGDFELSRGDLIYIAVGQQGKTDAYNAGGGGASWVMASDDSPYLVAGGGGATSYYGSYYGRRDGCDALTSSYAAQGGGTDYSTVVSGACSAKSSGLKLGGISPTTYAGNGGGGIDGNGADDAGGIWLGATGGFSWTNGAAGGKGAAAGGFGSGGAGNGSYGAGGGGGYSGGDAGRTISGGGGSFNSGTNQSNTVSNADDGTVSIELVSLK